MLPNRTHALGSLVLFSLASLALGTVGCSVEDSERSASTSSAYREPDRDETSSTTSNEPSNSGSLLPALPTDKQLFLRQSCGTEEGFYQADLDLSDREHPRYRLRTDLPKGDTGRDTRTFTHNNINIKLRNGHEWRSPDSLLSRPSSFDPMTVNVNDSAAVMQATAAADARDPWDDLPIPQSFLDEAFSVRADGLREIYKWEAVFDVPLSPDESCAGTFYGYADWGWSQTYSY
jgi:hypothetical protein